MNDAVSITRDLVRCPSVTPADAGALAVLENILKAAGFEVHHIEQEYAGFRRHYSRVWRIATPFSGTLTRINGPISRALGGLVVLGSKKSIIQPDLVAPRNGFASSRASNPHRSEVRDLPGRSVP